jgi:hypothetical protein
VSISHELLEAVNHLHQSVSQRNVRLSFDGKVLRRRIISLVLICTFIVLCAHTINAQKEAAKRVVMLKVDGLPSGMVDRFVHERDERTGKSLLPWIENVFYERGTRVANFYIRGMSISGPSWSMLDTGQHLQIKGNVEFDRCTLHSYDYLNFIPFYLNNALRRRVDMPGTELLDELGIPLLLDAYSYDERYQSFQLFQRGIRWTTLERALQNRFTKRSPRELFDEWTMGFEARSMVTDQLERELIEKLNNPRIRYLDFYTEQFDHAAHHNRDREAHLQALRELDAVIGRIWTAIQGSPLAADTAFILVSDHGSNTDESVYSQGYNLVKLLGSRAGGGHHVITKRRLLLDYSIKGLNPLVPLITTTTAESYYLKGESTDYPTALLDFDGNERAAIHLRDSDLNVLHIILQELQSESAAKQSDAWRRALIETFFQTIDRRRENWQNELSRLEEELGALHRLIAEWREATAAQPKKWTKTDQDMGRDKDALRLTARIDSAMADERDYTKYARTLANLLALRRDDFDPRKIKIEDVIVKGSMGERNTIYELQNYVVGVAPAGSALTVDGRQLDMEKSFARVNYFALLRNVTVRNNVQPTVSSKPIDFIATRIPYEQIARALNATDIRTSEDALWLYGGEQQQALILSREDRDGQLSLRYLPIANLTQEADGTVHFTRQTWRAGLPLKIWEDKYLTVFDPTREAFLDAWHTDVEWLRALHKTQYSNGLISLHEQLAYHDLDTLGLDQTGITLDERLLRRFRLRQRQLVETDFLILANNHWNFDVRGFNPGGNHGSLFRVSSNATLMMAGGACTGIPRGQLVEEPYDSLSLMPTILALTGQLRTSSSSSSGKEQPLPVLYERGFRAFPGRIIYEVINDMREKPGTAPVAAGEESFPSH